MSIAVDEDWVLAIGRATDIAEIGVFVHFPVIGGALSLAEGDRVWLRFQPPTASAPLKLSAAVVRVEPDADGGAKIGFEFVRLDHESQDIITDYVERQRPA